VPLCPAGARVLAPMSAAGSAGQAPVVAKVLGGDPRDYPALGLEPWPDLTSYRAYPCRTSPMHAPTP